MKKTNSILFIVLGFIAIVVMIVFWRQNSGPKHKTPSPKEAKVEGVPQSGVLVDMIKHDKELLTGKEGAAKPSESEVALSLKRLSFSDREEILPFIKKYEKHPSVIVRAAAVEAAGAMNSPELTQFLGEKLASTDELVRVASLKGLMRHQSLEHVSLVKKHLATLVNQGAKSSGPELLWARLVLARVSQVEQEREQVVAELLKTLNPEIGDPERDSDAVEVSNQLLNVFQGDRNVMDYAKQLLLKTRDEDLALHAFQYDIAYNLAWLKEKLTDAPMRKSPLYQGEVMAFVSKHCPAKAGKIVQSLDAANRKENTCSN